MRGGSFSSLNCKACPGYFLRWGLPSSSRAPIFSIPIVTILPSETHSHFPCLEGRLIANHIPAHFVHSSGHMTEEKWQETRLLKLGPTDIGPSSWNHSGEGGGPPSQGLGSVLHGRVSKSMQAPAGLPASHRRGKKSRPQGSLLTHQPSLSHSLRDSAAS